MKNHIKNYLKYQTPQEAFNILKSLRAEGNFHTGIYLGEYFIQQFPYYVDLLDEYGICCYYSGNYLKSHKIYTKLLNFPNITENEIEHILFNNHFNWNHIQGHYSNYNSEKVKEIINNSSSSVSPLNPVSNIAFNLPMVTFSVTTCKRIDLFKRTINSFINCCKDIHLISHWLCVDDNSSEEDRKEMKELYPFFDFYFKDITEKGHPKSMNIIRNKVKTPYLFHMEDDWEFFTKDKYISKCLQVLGENSHVKQCLVNKNYMETPEDVTRIIGGFFHTSKAGLKYYIHEHYPTATFGGYCHEFVERHGNKTNCAYWPHFSFRPSLVSTDIFEEIGEFNENANHFEMEYSYRYRSKGWESAFLLGMCSVHIGRLTSQRHDTTVKNAYSLNNENQFGELNNFNSKVKTYIVNLDKRTDRWETIKSLDMGDINYCRYSAVNGYDIKPNIHLSKIFDGNDYNMRKGIVGCALSHIKLSIELYYDNTVNYYMILEDDIEIVPDFNNKVKSVFNTLCKEHPDWDFVYLGHHMRKQYVTETTYSNDNYSEVEKWDVNKSLRISMGGTIGYIISKTGAGKLLEFIDKYGMTNAIDTMQQKAIQEGLNVYYCTTHLVKSECFRGDNNPDSDIQYNYESLYMKLDDRILLEIESFIDYLIIYINDYDKLPDDLGDNAVLVYDDRKSNKMDAFLTNYPTKYILDNSVAIYFNINIEYIYRLKRYIDKDWTYDISKAIHKNKSFIE